MDKQNEVYTYKGMVSSLYNEWHPDASFHMDEPWKHCAKSNNTDKKGENIARLYSYELPKISKFRDRK